MKGFLVDTNVISEVRKRNPHAAVASWFQSVEGTDLYLSALVIGEIRQGVERLTRRDPDQAQVFERWLARVKRDHADRIIPITTDIAEEWGRLGADRPIPAVDGMMAATARVHGLTLVTRNTGDLVDLGVRLLDPFS